VQWVGAAVRKGRRNSEATLLGVTFPISKLSASVGLSHYFARLKPKAEYSKNAHDRQWQTSGKESNTRRFGPRKPAVYTNDHG
jgi:hypothetical protein